MCVFYLNDSSRLVTLLHHVYFRSAISLIISDINCDLRGLQALEAVALTATPLIHILQDIRTRIEKKS